MKTTHTLKIRQDDFKRIRDRGYVTVLYDREFHKDIEHYLVLFEVVQVKMFFGLFKKWLKTGNGYKGLYVESYLSESLSQSDIDEYKGFYKEKDIIREGLITLYLKETKDFTYFFNSSHQECTEKRSKNTANK